MPVDVVGIADTVFENDATVNPKKEGATHLKGPNGTSITISIKCQVADHGGSSIDFVNAGKEGYASKLCVRKGSIEWLGSQGIVGSCQSNLSVF